MSPKWLPVLKKCKPKGHHIIISTSGVVHVAPVRAPLCHCLPSSGITRYLRYYAMIRLPLHYFDSLTFLSLVGHTPLFPKKNIEDLPSCRYIFMSSVPRSPTPRNFFNLTNSTFRMLHSAREKASAFPCSVFRGSTPSATAFGPLARLSTLKVGSYPPPSKTNYRRLVNLTGRDFHPLYVKAT